jgi:hypothetical protein
MVIKSQENKVKFNDKGIIESIVVNLYDRRLDSH